VRQEGAPGTPPLLHRKLPSLLVRCSLRRIRAVVAANAGGPVMRQCILGVAVCALLTVDAAGQGADRVASANGFRDPSNAGGSFDGVAFGGADLRRADFRGASLVEAGLEFVVLDGADFGSADLSYATVLPNSARYANFTRAILLRVTGNGANFDGAILGVSRAQGANFTGASFVGAYLADADLRGASLAFANLTDANLTGAKVADTSFVGAIWSNTICPDGTNSNANPNCGL
jgi:uncharacterized protein YjbI with pentapeptide repeats